MQITKDIEYRAAIYLRLSKDDGDLSLSGGKNESNSIASQRLLIKDFLKQHPEITVYDEYCDDGFTGTNFDRPRFQDMMTDIKKRRHKLYYCKRSVPFWKRVYRKRKIY